MWFWSNTCKERREECDQWLGVVLIKHMKRKEGGMCFNYICLIRITSNHGKIPTSFLYMCLIRTTSNHWSHSSLLRKEGGMWPMIRCGSDQTHVKKGGRNFTMIRCDSDQTYVIEGGRNVTNGVWSGPHLIIGHIPPSFLYMCLIRTTSNHWSHSSLLSLHSDQWLDVVLIKHM
jgi:hypothetical protein